MSFQGYYICLSCSAAMVSLLFFPKLKLCLLASLSYYVYGCHVSEYLKIYLVFLSESRIMPCPKG